METFTRKTQLTKHYIEGLATWFLPYFCLLEMQIYQFFVGNIQFGKQILAYCANRSYSIEKHNGFQTPEVAQRTYNRIHALANLPKHGNLENLKSVYVGRDTRLTLEDFYEFYTVTDRVGINTLLDELKRGTVFSIDDVFGIIGQLLEACYVAHSLGIFHTAIKPSNILVVKTNKKSSKVRKKYSIKLINFGSIVSEQDYPDKREMYYRSPEEITKWCAISCASDIWSIGMVASQLLMNLVVFDQPNDLLVVSKMVEICGRPSDGFVEKIGHVSKSVISDIGSDTRVNFKQEMEKWIKNNSNLKIRDEATCRDKIYTMIGFIEACLWIEPDLRITAKSGLIEFFNCTCTDNKSPPATPYLIRDYSLEHLNDEEEFEEAEHWRTKCFELVSGLRRQLSTTSTISDISESEYDFDFTDESDSYEKETNTTVPELDHSKSLAIESESVKSKFKTS